MRLHVMAMLWAAAAPAAALVISSFTPNKTLGLGNPWIGLVPYDFEASSNVVFPHAMENVYIPWLMVLTGPGQYNWSYVDELINGTASRGNQAIFRIYADYPHAAIANAVPYYLRPGLSFCNYTEDGGGTQPDYANETLVATMVETIHSMAARYDGDVRVAYLQVGFLGHWGEWHSESCPFAPLTTQATILQAFNQSFTQTRILLRYPDVSGGINVSTLNMGFHDDSFAQDTIGPQSWQFMQRMAAANALDQWKTQPIGGELRPELQKCIFAENITEACANAGVTPQDFNECVSTTHASWQWDYSCWQPGYSPANGDLARALTAASQMGYSLSVVSVSVTSSGAGQYNIAWVVQNNGVAPPYYPISGTLIVDDGSGFHSFSLVATAPFTSLLPGNTTTLSTTAPIVWAGSPPTANIGLALSSHRALKPIALATNGADGSGWVWVTISPP